MARLIFAPQAAEDLDAACAFIARDSSAYAAAFAARVLDVAEMLARFPEAGHTVPEFEDPTLRQFVCGSYRVIYELVGDAVHILAIHHGARLLRERPTRE